MRTKLFLLASAMACLCSCVQTDDYDDSLINKNVEVEFNLGRNAVTRSGIVTGTTMTQDFRVFGYVNSAQENVDVTASGARYIMKDARYLSSGSPADGKKYYWPAYSDFTANFTAYSPANYLENETEERRIEILEKIRRDGFKETFKNYENLYNVKSSSDYWNTIDLSTGEYCTVMNFYKTYNKFFE